MSTSYIRFDFMVYYIAWYLLTMTSVRQNSGVVGQDDLKKSYPADNSFWQQAPPTSTASLTSAIASNVTMTSKAHVYLINQGQTLEAMCEFQTDEFHLFDNPVVWKKIQRDEEIQINIMGNIFKPFLSTGRFEIEFAPEHPRFCFILRVSNVTVEDSGNYTCEVRGPKSTILASVTHTVFVRAPVRQVYLTVIDDDVIDVTEKTSAAHPASSSVEASSSSSSETSSDSRRSTSSSSSSVVGAMLPLPPLPSSALQSGGRITFVDGQPRRVGCVAVGGNPAPTLRVYLNDRDITGSMEQSASSTAAHGPPGLRLIVSRTELRDGTVTLSPADDGSRLRCVAAVSGLAANITETTINVHYGPVIQCEHRSADEDELSVYLCCLVRARPHVTSLFWIVDVNGTTLIDGENSNGYWSMVKDKTDAIETRLYLSRATARSFRPYTLVAENAVAETTQVVRLHRRLPGPSPPPWAAHSDRLRKNGASQQHHYYEDRHPSSPYATSSAETTFRLATTSRRASRVHLDPPGLSYRVLYGRTPLFNRQRSTVDQRKAIGSDWRLVGDTMNGRLLQSTVAGIISWCSSVVLVPLLMALVLSAPFEWTTTMCRVDNR